MTPRVPPPRSLRIVPLLLALACADGAMADDVTIYRCRDAQGKLSIRNTPCAAGQTQQQARSLPRVQDPAPKPSPPPASQAAAPPAPAPTVVVVRTPQPLYECVRADDSVYTSDDSEGDSHWVSGWEGDAGYPVIIGGRGIGRRSGGERGLRGGGSFAATSGVATSDGVGGGGNPTSRIRDVTEPARPRPSSGLRRPRSDRYDDGYGYGYGYGGAWVRDECHPLPQDEVCARIGDRRDEIRRRFFNAQPSERAVLSREERGINARLAADCGGGG